MIILLGLLIFVHELGHFLAAKFYKVRVETFSLGFGPKLLKFVHNETTYCVSALPLGGYVKMFGDEPGKEVPPELQNKAYLLKPVGQRIVIVLAGPLMNLFFAAFLFYAIAFIGDKAITPEIGEIAPNSIAYQEGFRPYDKILSINGKKVNTWDQANQLIENAPDQTLNFSIERMGEKKDLAVKPLTSANDNLFSTADKIGKIKGLNPNLHLAVVGVVYDSPIYHAGLRSGDRVVSVNDQKIEWFKDIEPTVLEELSSGPGEVILKVKRFADFRKGDEGKDFDIRLNAVDFTNQNLQIFAPDSIIAEVQADSPAAKAGLQRLDQLVSINGNPILSFDDIVKNVSSFDPKGKPLDVVVRRDGKEQSFSIVPLMNSLEGQFGETENRYTIGVVPVLFTVPNTFLWSSTSPLEASQRALEQTWHWTKVTMLSFVRIVQNRVSSKNISGIISIGQVAQQSWSIGLNAFLKMMAIISINLFVLNLLPIPILDGGHLVLFTLEALKGSPISLRKIEFAQQIGFLLILCLMAFALFNDFSRIFGS